MSQLQEEVLTGGQRTGNSKETARKRWHMLVQILMGESCTEIVDSKVSVRRFQSFGLLYAEPIQPAHLSSEHENGWFRYKCHDLPGFSMNVRHVDRAVTPETLHGFNNTGNICVWPSEEVMTYYCMQHVQDFKEQKVCELGGGMTCLAGVALGIYSEAAHVELTDGNEMSVQNLWSIIENNNFGMTTVSTRLLRWGNGQLEPELQSSYDIVICADCLFFDEGREDLANLIFDLLKPGGQSLIFAPSRNKTFYKFADIAEKLFQVFIDEEYNSRVWGLHQQMLKENPDVYEVSLHFPIMMKLTKPLSSSRDVTPESR